MKIFLLMLAVVLSFFHSIAHAAATGYFVNGVCEPDQASVISAFQSMFPVMQGGKLYSATYAGFYGNDYLQYYMQVTDPTTNTTTSVWNYLPNSFFSACDPSIALNDNLSVIAQSVSGVNASASSAVAVASSVAATVADSASFDLTNALAAFAFFFSMIIIIFMVANSSGMVLKLIRGRF